MREIITEELDRSAAIIMGGNEVVPRFRIAVPGDIDHVVLVPLPDALDERQRRLSLVSGYMAWRGASGFVCSTELAEPDATASIAVSRAAVFGAIRLITRQKTPRQALRLDPPAWLDRSSIGDEIPALLPPLATMLSATVLDELRRAFGPHGEFEAVKLH
jgi:hypothetical protein